MAKKRARRQRQATSKSQKRKEKLRSHFGGKAKPDFGNKVIKANWDDKLTLRQNYARLGLCSDVNADLTQGGGVESKMVMKRKIKATTGIITSELDKIQEQGAPAPYVTRSMSVKEQRMLQKLREKHGKDYVKMARDIAINTKQATPRQLEKRMATYLRLQNL